MVPSGIVKVGQCFQTYGRRGAPEINLPKGAGQPTKSWLSMDSSVEGCGLNLLSGVAELVRSVSPLVRSG